MALEFTRLADLAAHGYDSLIDVRSPSEFAEDHIPGALSMPVLSDAERARVGTIYVQEAPFRARKIGAALVARNAAAHIEGPLADKDGGWRGLVYCWRGGQRSGAFSALLREIGWRTETLAGGYRSYRRLVTAQLYDTPFPAPVVVLDGLTGTAKTELLYHLRDRGEQVIDLEGLAAHRGSALGAVDRDQPAQKGFESALSAEVTALDPARPVWVEAESAKVGARLIPPALWTAMQAAPRVEVTAPVAARAAYLVRAYDDLAADRQSAADRLDPLVPFQGHTRVAAWRELAHLGEGRALAAELMTHHYDPRYEKARARYADRVVATVSADSLEPAALDEISRRLVAARPIRSG